MFTSAICIYIYINYIYINIHIYITVIYIYIKIYMYVIYICILIYQKIFTCFFMQVGVSEAES
jgi:hypothetical protein